MKKRILDYLQLSLQGVAIASLGTLSIFEHSRSKKGVIKMSVMGWAFIFMATLGVGGIIYGIFGK